MPDLDEITRKGVLAEKAYEEAKQAYLFGVEAREDAATLAKRAGRVQLAACESAAADWELHAALDTSKSHTDDILDALRSAEISDSLTDLWDELVAAHEGRLPRAEEQLRSPSPREREILDFLLSVDFPGVDELRQQLTVAVARRCDRNSPTIELEVNPLRAPPAELEWEPVAVESETRSAARAAGTPYYELILFAAKGYMYQLYVGGEYELDEFPAPDIFDTPRPYAPHAGD